MTEFRNNDYFNSQLNTTNSLKSQFVDSLNLTDGAIVADYKELNNLNDLFDEAYFNSGDSEAAQIEAKIENLKKGIEALEKQAKEYDKYISEINVSIDDTNKKLLEIINNINSGTREYRDQVNNAVLLATNEACRLCHDGTTIGSDEDAFQGIFKRELDSKLKSLPGVSESQIKQWYAEYENLLNHINPEAQMLQNLYGEITTLDGRLQATNASINFLQARHDILTGKIDGYQNIDTNSTPPIYSGKKIAVTNKLGNIDYKTNLYNSSTASKQAVQNKWTSQNNKKLESGKDKYYHGSNPELANLGEALKNGMWEELSATGMTNDQIMEFIKKNWNVGSDSTFYRKNDGTWVVPYGHGKTGHQDNVNYPGHSDWAADADGKSRAIYDLLTQKAAQKPSATVASSENVDTESVSKLMDAVKNHDILNEMAKAGFTFKEAMYFIKETFGDKCGVEYLLSAQTGKANYGILADDAATGTFFADFAKTVKNLWGVEASTLTGNGDGLKTEVKTDPITFQSGEYMYTFLQLGAFDDGVFSGRDEVLGYSQDGTGDGGLEAFLALADENGNITGDALKQIPIMINHQIESSHDRSSISGTNDVDFNIGYTTASDLGITCINVNDINNSNGQTDLNGSENLGSMKITTDGTKLNKSINATRADATETYMKTFIDQIANNDSAKAIFTKFSDKDIEKFFSTWVVFQNASGQEINTASIAAMIEKMKKQLDDLIKQTEADNYDPNLSDRYALNIDYAEFLEWFGGDVTESKYVKEAVKVALEVGYDYRNKDTYHDERKKAKAAVQDALNTRGIGGQSLGTVDIEDDEIRENVHKSGK